MAQKDIAKILVTGPFAAGKTTLIRFVSSEQLLSKDVKATDALSRFKAMTTVGLDFGILHVDDNLDVHLFGTPGQSRFNFMWKVLSRGALGTIFLIDSSSQRAIDEGKKMYKYYRGKSDDPIVIGATHRDKEDARDLDALADELGAQDANMIPCDPRNKEDSKMLVLALLEEVMRDEADDELEEEALDDFELM
ncbi:MAG: ATP/GTP-binding protein [Mariprofundaceae bacterium]|nr:ATP/GTP-binding protein [Mariprofundaceae bacterium]